MHYLTGHWSFDPFLVVVIAAAACYQAGLARMRRADPEAARPWRRRTPLLYAGFAVVLIAVESPVNYWADEYFFVHMVQHLLLMFAAPTLIVAAAPWQPLAAALPGRAATLAGPLRGVAGWLLRPWVSVAAFNVVMLAWHVPALFDLSIRDAAVRVWLAHTTYLGAGLLFWLQFIGSPPVRRRMPLTSQALALIATNIIMWLLAMAMGILTTVSWYSVYNHVPGVTLPAFADQQIGAGILWICGDFWAIPTLIFVVRRLINEDGGIGSAVDHILGRGSRRYEWANRN
ncbi:MAG TPA: cytochrome c oxidase assembly protein [Streptosporangiaceae bacterium]|nr:cytochrome c oxidase assembly protein [Streptosporangiaceae bacterium]